MPMSPRTGRPATGNARAKVLPVRLSDDELALLASAADTESTKQSRNVTVSEYVRDAAVAKAKRQK